MKTIDIDLSYLIFAYQDESTENVYYLDTEFGDVRLVHRQLEDLRDLTDEIELAGDRFLYVPKGAPEKLIENLRIFEEKIENSELKRVLSVAFESPHVLQVFKKILSKHPDIEKQLDTFLYEKTKTEVLTWLLANAIAPASTS